MSNNIRVVKRNAAQLPQITVTEVQKPTERELERRIIAWVEESQRNIRNVRREESKALFQMTEKLTKLTKGDK